MNGHRWLVNGVLGVLLIFAPALASAQQPHPVLDAPGLQQNHDYFSEMPFENIDTLTGSLVLRFTDLVLPGNAGRELRFQRTYNSKTSYWTFGVAGIAMYIYNQPPPPLGVETPGPQGWAPTLYMGDGSQRTLAWFEAPDPANQSTFNQAISSDFWFFDRTGPGWKLYIPSGEICEYEIDVPGSNILRVKSCHDQFGNTIGFQWNLSLNPPQLLVTQSLSSSVSREVTVTFPDPAIEKRFPTSITYEGQTWTYVLDTAGVPRLTGVQPPGGAQGWEFNYDGGLTVTTPHGGMITYAFEQSWYETSEGPPNLAYTTVVGQRSTSGTGIEGGTWTYTYELETSTGFSGTTTVQTPSGRTVYHHEWTGDNNEFDGLAGATVLSSRIVQQLGGTGWVDLEREDRTYEMVPVLPWTPFGTLELKTRTVNRDNGDPNLQQINKTTIDFDTANYGDYHHPKHIKEEGTAGTRDTNYTYKHDFTIYLVGMPVNETMTSGSESFIKSWLYSQVY